MILNIFLRNFIYSTLGLVFFTFLFFDNLEMLYKKESILTDFSIPQFIGWLYPLTYFLLFWLFIIFQLRCIFNKKHAKKNLRRLHITLSVLYAAFSVVLLWFISTWYTLLFPVLTVFIALGLRNLYIYYRLKTKTYIWNIDPKDFFYGYSVYMLIIFLILFIFTRPILSNISSHYPEFHGDFSQWETLEVIDLIQEEQIDDYIISIAQQEDKSADYDTIIYNLNDKYLELLEDIFILSEGIIFENQTIEYSYNNLILVQKLNLIKYKYHILHSEIDMAKATISHILNINNNLLIKCNNHIDTAVFSHIQNFTLDAYLNTKNLFTEEENNEIWSHITDIDVDVLWENLLINELYSKFDSYDRLYNIPLLLDKSELKDLAYYYYINNLESPLSTTKIIEWKFHRTNYLGFIITKNSDFLLNNKYQKLLDLKEKISILK